MCLGLIVNMLTVWKVWQHILDCCLKSSSVYKGLVQLKLCVVSMHPIYVMGICHRRHRDGM